MRLRTVTSYSSDDSTPASSPELQDGSRSSIDIARSLNLVSSEEVVDLLQLGILENEIASRDIFEGTLLLPGGNNPSFSTNPGETDKEKEVEKKLLTRIQGSE